MDQEGQLGEGWPGPVGGALIKRISLLGKGPQGVPVGWGVHRV